MLIAKKFTKLFALALVLLPIDGCSTTSGTKDVLLSDHFDGSHFYNRLPSEKSAIDILMLGIQYPFIKQAWPDWIESEYSVKADEPSDSSPIVVTLINHSTVLILIDNVNILTDPIYSDRASPFSWAGPQRVRQPAISLEDLPPIDIILISHDHYDHLDIDTLKEIRDREKQKTPPVILTGLGTDKLLANNGINEVKTFDWGERVTYQGIEFVFSESRHRSGRWIHDQMKTLWGSFVIKSSYGNIYFAGDTGYGPHFKQAAADHGGFILSLLPIGAYQPRWFMKDIHLDPADAVRAHADLNSQKSIGIHYGTFQLTSEGVNDPINDLNQALQDKEVSSDEFQVLAFGKALDIEIL